MMSEFESPEEEAARILFGSDESPGPELDDETEMKNYLNMIKALMSEPVIVDLAIKSGAWREVHGEPHMDGTQTVYLDKYHDKPGKVGVTIPSFYVVLDRREANDV